MKSVIDRLQRVLRLPPAERAVLVQGWGLFVLAALALRILPFRFLLTLTEAASIRRRGEGSIRPAPAAVISRTAALVDVAGRYAPVRMTCLNKALVLSWLLGRRGIPTTVQIGVAREAGGLKAHAWLEREGQVIADQAAAAGYEPLLPTA